MADGVALDEGLRGLLERARRRFPAISVDDGALVERIAVIAELDPEVEVASAVAKLSEEVVLTAACISGDPGAVRELEHTYRHQLAPMVRGIVGDRSDDVLQDVWTKLLIGGARLADYGGRGSLLSWLRVVTAREALSTLRRNRRAVALDDDTLWGNLVASHDPQLALIRAETAAAIKRAFGLAVAQLAVRERNLLRQHILDGLTIDDLAPMYGVHRVTVARWLTAARETVWAATQGSLREQLKLTRSQLDSLLASAREWIDLSLERVLE